MNPSTPGVVIKNGFLNLNRSLLVDHSDVVVDGQATCAFYFIRSESV